MVAVHHNDIFGIFWVGGKYTVEVGVHAMSNDEERLDGRGAVVLPLVWLYVAQLRLVDITAAQVDNDEAFGVPLLKKLCNFVNRIPVELFDAWSWECHGYDSIRDVGEVEIVPILLESVLGTAY